MTAVLFLPGTVVFNSAGGFIPKLAGVCLQCVNAFDLPCALNMYLTDAGQAVSAPPHTDKQDVFVMQTQGQKHWRVFAPPPPSRMPRTDPLARGKASDQLSISELESPIMDVVLSPGNVLYIPAGYPHTTDTVSGITMTGEPSVHLTVGLDTHIWGLNYAALRGNVLKKLNIKDKVVLTKLEPNLYWDSQSCLPLGFLEKKSLKDKKSGESLTDKPTQLSADFLNRIKTIDSEWDISGENSALNECVSKVLEHHRDITDTFGRMYADVCMKISPAQFDLSFFRSKVR